MVDLMNIESSNGDFRLEHDSLGEKRVPAKALYGVQTQRAVENFPISGYGPHPLFVTATVLVKKAAAMANSQTGRLDTGVAQAIIAAADEVLDGKWRDQFVVDIFQAGAGTSHNMNTNEVLANRALEILGQPRGYYDTVHPNDMVNMAQSTNDVIPTAIKVGSLLALQNFEPVMVDLVAAFKAKAIEFDDVIKSGRTHLQDAVPIRLGQEFAAYALTLDRARKRIMNAAESLKELNIGATAVGTGLNAEPEYMRLVVENLSKLTNINFRNAENLVQATQSMEAFVEVSNTLKSLAVELTKIANDLRLMSSGPRTGIGEINLPAVQPGSSIMPGKVNPVMAEMLNMVCFQVLGNDLALTFAAQAGQFELNVMMPLIANDLLQNITILTNSLRVFTTDCVQGITANVEKNRQYVEQSTGLATALAPYIGYEKAAAIAKETLSTGKSIRQLALDKGYFEAAQLDKILSPYEMTKPGIAGKS